MKIHLISIGGSVMHQLAIALKRKGYQITGTDDEIKWIFIDNELFKR